MQVVIFAGPTLYKQRSAALDDVDWRPPVKFGDVFRAAVGGAAVIGIIDGYFEQVPSVWHKEILWALHQGCHVLGSASMGALRAAELDSFGMRGIGRIYEAFRDGLLTDDDEVAVRHGPAALGYPPLSETMVTIRVTLKHAVATGVVSASCAAAVESSAKRLFYGERTFARAVEDASANAFSEELARLTAWLPDGRIDQKQADAVEMLTAIENDRTEYSRPFCSSFQFEYSSSWVSAMLRLDPDFTNTHLLV